MPTFLKALVWIIVIALVLSIAFSGALWLLRRSDVWLPSRIEPIPSQNVQQLLLNQPFYFQSGKLIYETIGHQKRAKIFCGNMSKFEWCLFPTLSPNNNYLAFYRAFDICNSIQLVVHDRSSGEETVVFQGENSTRPEQYESSLCGYETGVAVDDLSQPPYYALDWLDDHTLRFNAGDNNYTYNPTTRNTVKNVGLNDSISRDVVVCTDRFSDCFRAMNNRFTFTHDRSYESGFNCASYIKGVDNLTKEKFRLTILNRNFLCFE